jgi:hypothetical protein
VILILVKKKLIKILRSEYRITAKVFRDY